MDISSLVRVNVRDLVPFSSARAEFGGKADVFLDANENPVPTSINRYPDPHQTDLVQELASQMGVKESQVILGNGSDELIDLIIRTFCEPREDIVRYISPSFGMYEVMARINDVRVEPIPLKEGFSLDIDACLNGLTSRHKVIFLCSPNNPTGNSFSGEAVLKIVKSFTGIVVLDEAYIEFSGQSSLAGEIGHWNNLLILQTFSKAKGGAGLRVGISYSSEEVISYLKKIKPPYNVGTIAQEKALEILKNREEHLSFIKEIRIERDLMMDNLKSLLFVKEVFPSEANFLLVRFDNSTNIKNYLMSKNIIVRDRSRLPMCQNCLRITIGLPSENKRLIVALKNYKA